MCASDEVSAVESRVTTVVQPLGVRHHTSDSEARTNSNNYQTSIHQVAGCQAEVTDIEEVDEAVHGRTRNHDDGTGDGHRNTRNPHRRSDDCGNQTNEESRDKCTRLGRQIQTYDALVDEDELQQVSGSARHRRQQCHPAGAVEEHGEAGNTDKGGDPYEERPPLDAEANLVGVTDLGEWLQTGRQGDNPHRAGSGSQECQHVGETLDTGVEVEFRQVQEAGEHGEAGNKKEY